MTWNIIWHQAMTMPFWTGVLASKNRTTSFKLISYQTGNRVRLHFCNNFGKKPYLIGSVTIHYNSHVYQITVGGQKEFKVLPGEQIYSDEVECDVKAEDTLDVRIYYRSKILDVNAIESKAIIGKGNLTLDSEMPIKRRAEILEKNAYWENIPSLDRVEVYSDVNAQSIVLFGDSITAQNRWAKPLAKRIYEQYKDSYQLVNSGIAGNCLTYEIKTHNLWRLFKKTYGEMGTRRFERDVLSIPNLHTVIIAIGINDISYMKNNTMKYVNLSNLKSKIESVVKALREQNCKVVAHTLSPRLGFMMKWTSEMEEIRIEYNEWLKTCQLFDYIVDVDELLKDSENPHVLDEKYHQGDHLHPNCQGGQLIAATYDLNKII